MNELEIRLLGELKDFFALETSSASGGELLLNKLQAIAVIEKQMGETIHPQLKHYLKNRSYQKAIAFLENPDLPHQP